MCSIGMIVVFVILFLCIVKIIIFVIFFMILLVFGMALVFLGNR